MTYCPGVPIVFVACKKDLRDDRRGIDALRRRGESVVTLEQVRSCFIHILQVL